MTPASRRLLDLLRGPYPALPRPLDALAERWARLRPRVRLAIALLCVGALGTGVGTRVRQAEARWGGPPVTVWVAVADTPVGEVPELRRVELPPGAVPPRAATDGASGAPLALALPEGAVLTDIHLSSAGPAASLPADLRVVPIPVKDGWGVTAGGRVDVWVLGAGEEPAARVATGRPVLEVKRDSVGEATALVGLATEEVAPATSGLALGQVLLTHAPPD